MPVHLYINGIKQAGFFNWPSVPRVGDMLTWAKNPPSNLHGCSARVMRVVWVVQPQPEAHVYLKGAWI